MEGDSRQKQKKAASALRKIAHHGNGSFIVSISPHFCQHALQNDTSGKRQKNVHFH